MSDGRRVLVVEDEGTLRGFLVEALGDEGYDVRAAEHGREALEALAHWQPNVIVLDLMMPVMDGWTFRREQRARGLALGVPLVLLSAVADLDSQSAQLGASAVISKPFDLGAFLDTIDDLTGPEGSAPAA
jgi:CheY-like chemotaxis protein